MKKFAAVMLAGWLLFLAAPDMVVAQGLVPISCQTPQSCGTCEFVQLINNVLQFLVSFASIAATLLIIYGGFRLVTSAGNVSGKQAAKSTIVNTLIGYVIILAAFIILNTILGVLLPGNSPVLGWQQIECLYPNQPQSVTYGTIGVGSSGVPMGGDGLVIGGPRGVAQCAEGNEVCSVEALQGLGLSATQANIMSCVAITENSGRAVGCSGTGPCGAFQISRADWRRYSPQVPGCTEDNFANLTAAQNNGSCNQRVMAVMVQSERGYQPWTGQLNGVPWNAAARRCVQEYSTAGDGTNRGF
jgi:hypothetical protein